MIEFAMAEFARGALSSSMPGPRGREAVSSAVRSAAEFAAVSYDRTEPAGDRLRPLACKAGCSFCCHMRVVATVPEMIALIDFIISNFTDEAVRAIRRRVAETDRQTRGLSDEQWGAAGHPCPLLVDGMCSVYAARPLDCRGYNSTSVESCRAAAQSYLDWNVPMVEGLMSAFKSAQAGFLQALAGSGHRPRLVELTAALRVMLEDPSAVDRWFAGDNPFAGAELDPADPEQRAFLPWVPSDQLRAAAESEEAS